ncbi:MAG: hypothetical protein IPK70_02770 [Flavobacteriales bacterium]|nr:hypothetical protein [Flavobacteriales bacterium]
MSNYKVDVIDADPNYLYLVTRPDDHQLHETVINGDLVTLKYIEVNPSTGPTDTVDSGIRYGSVTEDREITFNISLDGGPTHKLTCIIRRTGG